ncbi:MAG: DUF1972 domain-containing protein [Bacteroidales bacterium]|nr:DUF1972 domain-containing protein [Bacteroidales bacterium]
MRKTIAIIGAVGIPARYGGFETLAENLAEGLAKHFDVNVTCDSTVYQLPIKKSLQGINRILVGFKANGWQSVIHDIIAMHKVMKNADSIIVLGISSAFYIGILKIFNRRVNVILHCDGEEWKRKRWGLITRLYLYFSYRLGIQFAHKIVADNLEIKKNILKLTSHSVHLITYGGNFSIIENQELLPTEKNYFLTIARFVPENNLDLIARCFENIPDEKWILISNFNSSKTGKRFFEKYQKIPNIHCVQSNYNVAEINSYRSNCKAYIHGHSTGGTNPSLVEILWYRKPVICHANKYNQTTTKGMALYFKTASELKKLIKCKKYMTINTDILYNYAIENYNWEKVVSEYRKLL